MPVSIRQPRIEAYQKARRRPLSSLLGIDAASRIELDGQYRALREEAGFLGRQRGVALVRGLDAAEFLQGQLTNDLDAVGEDEGCYAALLDRKGHMQADMRVLRLSTGDIWLDSEPEAIGAVVRHLGMYSVGREVEITEASDAWAVTSLIGPVAAEAAGAGPLHGEHARATSIARESRCWRSPPTSAST